MSKFEAIMVSDALQYAKDYRPDPAVSAQDTWECWSSLLPNGYRRLYLEAYDVINDHDRGNEKVAVYVIDSTEEEHGWNLIIEKRHGNGLPD